MLLVACALGGLLTAPSYGQQAPEAPTWGASTETSTWEASTWRLAEAAARGAAPLAPVLLPVPGVRTRPPEAVWAPDSAAVTKPGEGVNYRRLAVVGLPLAGAGVGTYVYLQRTWWAEGRSRFHFDWHKELRYAKNLDKMGHLLGGTVTATLFYDALRWSEMPPGRARWWAAGLASSAQMIVELKDGFAARWGFGILDVASGALGSLYPVAQEHVPFLADTDLKFSYWRRSDAYLDNYPEGAWHDDYINQTYWLSHNINNRLPASVEPYWPDFLGVALGLGVDDELNDRLQPVRYELFLSLDVDLVELLPDGPPAWERIKRYLNFVKLPTPALRLAPSVKGFALYW